MKLDGRRISSNVDDRRGSGRAMKAGGLGLGGIIIIGLIAWLMGGDPAEVVDQVSNMTTNTQQTEYIPSPEEEALATFSAQILASTEDVWRKFSGKTVAPIPSQTCSLYRSGDFRLRWRISRMWSFLLLS